MNLQNCVFNESIARAESARRVADRLADEAAAWAQAAASNSGVQAIADAIKADAVKADRYAKRMERLTNALSAMEN